MFYMCLMKLLMFHFVVPLLYELDDLCKQGSALSLEKFPCNHC